jgi:cobalamin biosynthesis protein CobD/CbiB
MAAFAGLLNVRLEKRGMYSLNGPSPNHHGTTGVPPDYNDIRRGQAIADIAGVLLFLLAIISITVLYAVGYYYPGEFSQPIAPLPR